MGAGVVAGAGDCVVAVASEVGLAVCTGLAFAFASDVDVGLPPVAVAPDVELGLPPVAVDVGFPPVAVAPATGLAVCTGFAVAPDVEIGFAITDGLAVAPDVDADVGLA